MTYRVVLVGGGSGGHVYPLMAVADALKLKAQQNNIPLELLVIGEGKFMKSATLESGLKYKSVMAGKLRRYASALNFVDFLKLPFGLVQSLWYLYWFMPEAVFAKGGYASLAPVLAAKFYFIPVYLHESDSVPGLANGILAMFARKVFVAYPNAEKSFGGKALRVGNPVRKELFGTDRSVALTVFNFSGDKKTILVLGGSQGAKQINDIVLNALVPLTKDYQLIHQCGETQAKVVQVAVDTIIKEGEGEYGEIVKANYRVYPFMDTKTMAAAYAVCDLVISRAGANVLAEIAILGRPAIVIPLDGSAGNHQMLNAIELAKYGGVTIEGNNATTNILLNQIHLLFDPTKYQQVSQQIKGFATPEAADKIAEAILSRT